MTTELLDAEPITAIVEYVPFYAQLAELEENNKKLVFNYSDKKDNKLARSHVFSLRKTKSSLETVRKDAKSESLRIGRAIDSEAAEIGLRIEAMIKVHQDQIDLIEKQETDRIKAIQARLTALKVSFPATHSQAELKFHIATLEAVVIDKSWQEFIAEAAQAKDVSLAYHRNELADRIKHDNEAIELEKLRKEAAKRAQEDKDAAIALQAKDKAELAAKALIEQEAAKAARAIADAEIQAKKLKEESELRELKLKLDAETAERRRVESEQALAQSLKDAELREQQARLKAFDEERNRVKALAEAEEKLQQQREANKAHLRKINKSALDAFVNGGIDEDVAKLVITLIVNKNIPNIEIHY